MRSPRNVPLAIATGVLLVALFAVSLWIGPWALLALVAAVVAMAIIEFASACAEGGVRPTTTVLAVLGPAMGPVAYALGPTALLAALMATLLAISAVIVAGGRRIMALERFGVSSLALLWIPFSASFCGLLLARPQGSSVLLAVVGLTVVADTAAYAVGSVFGRHRLAPRVSPSKTWEGTVGAGVAVVVVSAVALPVGLANLGTVPAMVLGSVIFLAATVGDLSASLLKRSLGRKDFSRLVPGHGGILDRVDSLLFAIPAAALTLSLLVPAP